ncbi:MAG TPA: hypothetical protein VJG30_04185 [Candidatus Nanoarchaeia archaeon]|nr:hypothetical protein [Candidatus Nanoarchaeia archaeon]
MEEEGVITFDSLYEALRLEKYKTELQKLDKNFYKKSVKYLEEKKAILKSQESKDSVFANESIIKTKRQLENTRMIIKELYEKREAKIINMALFNSRSAGSVQDTESLLEEEKDMYNTILGIFNNFRINVLYNLLEGKGPQKVKETNTTTEEVKSNKLVRFTEAVPKFVGNDLNIYGPYEAEDVANLPGKVAEILVKNRRAEGI